MGGTKRKKRKSRKRKDSSSGGGAMMGFRRGFKGVVGSVTGSQPKSKAGKKASDIFWTILTILAVALLAYRLYQWLT